MTTLRIDWQWELQTLRRGLRSKRSYLALGGTALGTLLVAMALNGLVLPLELGSSGIMGLAILGYYVFGVPDPAWGYLILNVPLFLLGWRAYSLSYVLLALLGVGIFSTALYLTRTISIPLDDPLLASILAGVMAGGGVGLYLSVGGSAGGLDILAAYIRRRWAIPMGLVFMVVNSVSLIGIALIGGLEAAVSTGLFMAISSWILERVPSGFGQRRAVWIISARTTAIATEVMQQLDRSVTYFRATQGYSAAPTEVIFTVVNLFELGRLKQLIRDVDPEAFVVVYSTSDVIGKRFLTWEDQGYVRPSAQAR